MATLAAASAFLLTLGSASAAATLYVSVNGSDSAVGTSAATPLASCAAA